MEGYYTYFVLEFRYNGIKKKERAARDPLRKTERKYKMRINVYSNTKNVTDLIPNDSYIRVYGFMRSQMGLEKTELLVYALIYSYFRNCESLSGSREYIAEWVGSGRTAVDRAIASLIKKGYITKESRCYRGLHYIEYNINVEALPTSSEHTGMLEMWREDKRKCRNM